MNRLEKVQMMSRLWNRNFQQSSLLSYFSEFSIIIHYSFNDFLDVILSTEDETDFSKDKIEKYDWTICFFNVALSYKYQIATLYPGKQIFLNLYARDHKYLDYELLKSLIDLCPNFALFNYHELKQNTSELIQTLSANTPLSHYDIIITSSDNTAYKLTKRLQNSHEVWLVKKGDITKYENKEHSEGI